MIETLFAALFAALALLFIPHPVATARSVAPTSAHGGSRGPSSPSPAGRLSGGVSHLPQPTSAPASVAVPPPPVDPSRMITCPNGTEWQGSDFGCVATQLPGETDGRAEG